MGSRSSTIGEPLIGTFFDQEVIILSKLGAMPDRQFLFGSIFIVANRLDTLMRRVFKRYDVTTKQWFLSIVVDNLFHEPPTIQEAAGEMGSSHQNVKQIALKMEQKGLLELVKDQSDARITRLKPTARSRDLWSRLKKEGDAYSERLFEGVDASDLKAARAVMMRLLENLSKMERGD